MKNAMRSASNFFVSKILPVSNSSSKIFSRFHANPMIPLNQGEGGYTRHSNPSCDFVSFVVQGFWILLATLTFAALFSAPASAQAQRGTLVHEETIRVSPSADTAKLGQAGRGYELVVIDTSRDWTHVEAIIREPRKGEDDEDDEEDNTKTITGWVQNKALITMSTQDGDKIIFGEAANSEDEASRRRGRRDRS